MKNKKEWLKYIILFILFFVSMTLVFFAYRLDAYSDYGFAYAMSMGQPPYKEVNFIVPPVAPMLYSISLIINKSIIAFYLEQSILLVLLCYLLFKILDKKAWIIIVSLFSLFPTSQFPGYNFLLMFELILLLYLETNNKSDKLIGIVSALTVLTKHNVGAFIFLVTILYPLFKDKKKSLQRLLYGMIPFIIFLIYLLSTNSLYNFINLCFLGISDFQNNTNIEYFYLITVIITYIFMIIKFIKDKNKNITYFYFFVFVLIAYPLMEKHHTTYYLIVLLTVFLYNSNIKIKIKNISQISIMLIILIMSSYYLLVKDLFDMYNIYSYHNFPIEVMDEEDKETRDDIIKYIRNKKVIFITDRPDHTTFYLSTTNKKMTKYLVQFHGNYGKDGYTNLKKDLLKEQKTYFIVNENINKNKNSQFYKGLPKFIMKNSKYIKKIGNYSVYYKE